MNILFVSIAFPPKLDPECLQTAKYFKYLVRDRDIQFTVITSASPTLYMPVDSNLKKYDQGYQQKIELKIPENKYLNFLMRKLIPDFLDTPDSKKIFIYQSSKVLKNLRTKPDVIYSRSSPMSSALLALKLKKKLKKPWVMHISDPWVGSPLRNYSESLYKKNKRLEEECFSEAEKICVTTEKTLEFYSKIYPQFKNKFEVYPNVYDPEDFKFSEFETKTNSVQLKIVHTGGLTAKRSAVYLIPVLKQLEQNGFDVNKNLEIIFAGDADRLNKKVFEDNSFSCMKYLGKVGYDESKKLQHDAHLLLCIEDPIEDINTSMFFPSKILDYIVAGKKFFALTSEGSQLSRIFKKYGWTFFNHEDIDGVAAYFKNSFEQVKEGNETYFSVQHKPEEFSAEKNAIRLNQLFRSLCERSI